MIKMKINPVVLIVGIGLLLFGGMLFTYNQNSSSNNISAQIILPSSTSQQATNNSVKEFDTQITGFSYSPETITVKLNDRVKINIKNNDSVTHGISLPVFGVQESVRPGQIKTIQFIANKTGNPETFCSTDHGEKLLINVIA